MFVALVGLAGLAALFWLGGIEMSEGAKSERALAVARAAQRSFKILGMHRPIQSFTYNSGTGSQTMQVQMWLTQDQNGTKTYPIDNSAISPSPSTLATYSLPVMPFSQTSLPTGGGGTPAPNALLGQYSQGFCIDPIGMCANFEDATPFPSFDPTGAWIGPWQSQNVGLPTVNGTAAPNLTQYTYLTGSSSPAVSGSPPSYPCLPCLSRVNLRAYPTAGLGTPGIAAYTAGQAELVFRSQDDLLLNAPEGDNPPTQLFSGPAATPNRRQFQGDYSWLATVVPSFRSFQTVYNASASPPTATITAQGDTNAVIVSIVVFYKRIPAMNVNGPFNFAGAPPSERMVAVAGTVNGTQLSSTATYPTGTAGGDIQLTLGTPSASLTDPAAQQAYLNVKPGQWIMLSQGPQFANATYPYGSPNYPNPIPNTASCTPFWYRWYKVVGAGPVQLNTAASPASYYRNVTLSGPDWNPGTQANPIATYASIFDGVVAVYEKEMELEQSGAPGAPN